MGNDQLLPAYNMKAAICDEYIAVIDAKPYASDMEKFIFRYHTHVKGNKYDRTEEVYECENCEGCPYRSECTKKQEGNRTARLNKELTSFHHEVITNLESIHGALLCMNRSIQSEGTFGIIKWDRAYKRLFRRGEKSVILEFTLISCGFNLYKYHNKKQRLQKAV